MSWLDGRASGLVDEWARSGVTEEVFRISGGTMFPGAPAACLKWLDLNEPQTLDRAATAGYCKDVIFGRLTGERATDPSDASMPFGDGTGLAYSDRVLELTGLAHRRSLLAPIVAPVPVAELHAEGASLLGLPAGTPVTSGPFDFPACGFGAGMAWPGTEGDALMIVGTTWAAWCTSTSWSPPVSPRGSAWPPASPAVGCGPCPPWSAPPRWTGCCACSGSSSAPSRACWARARPGPTA